MSSRISKATSNGVFLVRPIIVVYPPAFRILQMIKINNFNNLFITENHHRKREYVVWVLRQSKR